MSTSVCQGMQSQLDPWLVEPRIIGFKLSQPAPKFSPSSVCFPRSDNSCANQQTTHKTDICSEIINQKKSRNGDLGWSFLQALTNPTHVSEIVKNEDIEKAKEKEYVHPLVKKSASMLSEKSLEMCTESLGSETGSIICDTEDELISSSFVSDHEKSPRMQPCVTMIKERSMSINSSSFPPPITTLRSASSGGVHVESQREDGRLVIKAVSVGTSKTCFMAERTNGRLTLRFLDNSCELNRELPLGDEFYDGHDNNQGNTNEDEYIVKDGHLYNDMEGNIVTRNRCNDELATGRCKGLQNWEPYWVATSS